MTSLRKICLNLAELCKELDAELLPSSIDSTIPRDGGHRHAGSRPPCSLTTLHTKMDYESEIKDLIVQVCQHADIDTASLASKPLPMWCVWLAANTDLVQLHPEPDVIDQGLRTLERELYRRHDRESPVMPSGGWYLLRDCLAQAQQHGYQVSAKQLRHWRARGYVRAAHRRDGTLHYALADVLEKASVD